MFGSGSGAFSGGAENQSKKTGFGKSAFGKPAAPAVFGTTSLFNQTTQPNTGLFGSTAAAPAFGQTPTAQPTFGGFNTDGTCGSSVFGSPTSTSASTGGLFGQQNVSMGENTGGGLFGSSKPNTSFGQSKPVKTGFPFGIPKVAQPTGNIFGTPQASTIVTGIFGASTTTGTFTAASVFEGTCAGSFSTIKFNPVTGTDTIVRNGIDQTINTMHQSITIMKEYETKIFEELRFKDYSANRKVGQEGDVQSRNFGYPKTIYSFTPITSTGLFGANDNKPLFGATSKTLAFGGFNTGGTCGSSVFGSPTSTSASTGGLFGQQNVSMGENTGGGLFGSSKPNTAFGQSKPVRTGFPFGTPVMPPSSNIFGTSQPSTADTRMCNELASKEYSLEKVVDEPVLNNLIRPVHPFSIPQVIRSKPKQYCGSPKIVLGLSWSSSENRCITNWYDPAKNLFQIAPEMFIQRDGAGLCVVKDKFVVAVGGNSWNANSTRSVEILDVSSQSMCWIPKVKLLVGRKNVGVGVLDGCIYAVGGYEVEGFTINNTNHNISQFRENNYLNSAEVFNFGSQQWRMVTSMFNKRSNFGVAVLNNLLYAVGGFNGSSCLKFVECYNPILDTWNPIAEMSVCRLGAGVGVLDGIMYVIGGTNASVTLKSVEAYSPNTGVWTSMADMNLCRQNPGVVVFDGLLYVMGGKDGSIYLNSLEIYNPNTNSWSMKTLSTSHLPIYGAVVVDRPPHLTFKK